jgi:hypothetical protein
VRYYARVVDTHPSAQVGVARDFALRMPAASELRREAEATIESVAERLEAMRAEAERQADLSQTQAIEAAARPDVPEPRAGDPAQPGFQQREEQRRASDQQAALLAQADSLAASLAELQRTLEELGQADPELAAALEELQELLERLGEQPETDAQIQPSGDRGVQAPPELPTDPQQLRQQLEATLEQFRRAAVEQDFRATTDEAAELARQQRALAEAMREADDPELRADQQAQLADRAEQLEAQMQALADRLSQLEENW